MLKYFKWYWMIAGYNTASAKQKQNYDIRGFSNLVFIYCIGLAVVVLLSGIFFTMVIY